MVTINQLKCGGVCFGERQSSRLFKAQSLLVGTNNIGRKLRYGTESLGAFSDPPLVVVGMVTSCLGIINM